MKVISFVDGNLRKQHFEVSSLAEFSSSGVGVTAQFSRARIALSLSNNDY